MSKLASALLKSAVHGVPNVKKAVIPRKPSAYIVFSTETRKELAAEPSFQAMTATEKMTHIAEKWGTADKDVWKNKADAMPAPVAPPTEELPQFPSFIKLRDQKTFDTVSKRVATAAIQELFEELLAKPVGGELTIQGIGKLSVTVNEKPKKNERELLLKLSSSLVKTLE